MEIYLVRHAEALERNDSLPDEARYLTDKGRKQASKQARRLKKLIDPELILFSPLVRAVQTAELLAVKAGKKAVMAAHQCLAPGGEVEAVITMIRKSAKLKSVILVGHEPQLSLIAARMLGYEHVNALSKGGCLALSWKAEKQDAHARFEWYAPCEKKRVTSARKALACKN